MAVNEPNRVGGEIELVVNGERYRARGSWTYSSGTTVREGIAGADGVHGYKGMPRVPYIEGEITDHGRFDLERAHRELVDGTVVLRLANGKARVLRNAWAAGEWNGNTEEGNVSVRFEGLSMEEVTR